jgi:hypothetical protein
MAETLPRPSVKVEQIIRTPTAQVSTPTFNPVVIGKCIQKVPAQVTTATGGRQINAQAKVTMPAMARSIDATGDPPVFSLVANDCLVFSITNKQKVVAAFDTTGDYTPADVASIIAKAMVDVGEEEATVEVISPTDGPVGGIAFRIITAGRNDLTTIEVDPEGRSAASVTGSVDLTSLTYPGDVTGLTFQVAIDNGAPQPYTVGSPANAAALISALSTAIVGGTASLEVGTNDLVITSDLTGETSKVEITGGTLLAVVGLTAGDVDAGTGSTSGALTAFGFDTTDLFFGAASYANYELSIAPAVFPDPKGNLSSLVFDIPSIRAFLNNSGGSTLLEPLRTTALLRKASGSGIVTVVDDGNGDSRSPFVSISGQNFLNPTPTAAQVTASGAPSFASLSNKTVYLSDGRAPRAVNFGTVAAIADVVNAINAVFNTSDGLIASNSGGNLRLTSTRLREDGATLAVGEDSQIVVYGGNGVTFLDSGGTPVLKTGRFTGNPQKALVGDDLYVDGTFLGKIIQVAPSGVTTRLKLDRQVALTLTGDSFYIIAKGLKSINDGGATDRPAPDLIVESDGTVILKHGILRSAATGAVNESIVTNTLYPSKANVYIQYEALRLDVSPVADDGILSLPSTQSVETLLDPVDASNPLALGAYIAKLNAPLVAVKALGIDAYSADQPDGTTEAHSRAAAYLERFEVYSLAVLSQDEDVFSVWKTHVDTMSQPEKKRERIVFLNGKQPTRGRDTLVASGAEGNKISTTVFDTGIASLASMLLGLDINPVGTIDADAGVYLDVDGDASRYSISEVNGSQVTLRTSFAPSENADDFYATVGIPGTLIDVTFAIRVRGAKLELPNGKPDKDAIAETYKKTGQAFSHKRVFYTMPDTCSSIVNGVEVQLPGYFMCAALAGMVSSNPPQQSFTNVPLTGIKSCIGSQRAFTEDQLDAIAFGGVWIFVQDEATGPVLNRHAISTDRSSLETQTDNITKQLDFVAKFQRQSLKNFLGRMNVDDDSSTTINTTIQSTIQLLEEGRIIKSIKVLSLEVSGKDEYLLEEEIEVFYPINGITVRLYI